MWRSQLETAGFPGCAVPERLAAMRAAIAALVLTGGAWPFHSAAQAGQESSSQSPLRLAPSTLSTTWDQQITSEPARPL